MNKYLTISGRVQGVGFRYAALQRARKLELVGWVQNKSDGTVELEVEGEKVQVNAYVEELKSGLGPFIRVDHIEEKTSWEEKGYLDFTIK